MDLYNTGSYGHMIPISQPSFFFHTEAACVDDIRNTYLLFCFRRRVLLLCFYVVLGISTFLPISPVVGFSIFIITSLTLSFNRSGHNHP